MVKIKIIIQVLACILLGYMTKGADRLHDGQHRPYDNAGYYNNTSTLSDGLGFQDEQASFTSRLPRHKQLKYRTRFRAASSFTVSYTPPAEEPRSFVHHRWAVPLPANSKERLLPFYYIFLFRFTPF